MAQSIPTVTDIEFVTAVHALPAAFAAKPADLILIGQAPNSTTGTDATNLLLTQYPSARVIAYGSSDRTAQLTAAVACGALGFLIWAPTESHTIPTPNDPTARPESEHTPPTTATTLPPKLTERNLTPRELQILEGMSRGLSNREIGRELSLSEHVVKRFAGDLFTSLDVHDRGHAVALGMRMGLIE